MRGYAFLRVVRQAITYVLIAGCRVWMLEDGFPNITRSLKGGYPIETNQRGMGLSSGSEVVEHGAFCLIIRSWTARRGILLCCVTYPRGPRVVTLSVGM